MTDYYADSSVLVKRHVRETGTAWFRAVADPVAGHSITTARLSMVEIYSAVSRRLREGHLTPDQYAEVITDFTAFCAAEYEFIELTSTVIRHARALLEHHPLRAYDAVQLASALAVRERLEASGLPAPVFLTADNQLLSAAQAEGLAVDNPNLHP
jgi:predicted nucleic acid-binding protein